MKSLFRQHAWRFDSPRAAALLGLTLAVPAGAAPAKPKTSPAKAAPKAAPHAISLTVLPASVKLVGPRSEQGLLVSARFSDGSTRDVTDAAKLTVSNPRVAVVETEETRRVLRPKGDGPATVTVSLPGAPPATVKLEVQGSGELAPVSFVDEVVPALTKAGCSQGVCHGTPTGKGGLRLSLQGYAPELDYKAIVSEGGARRVNKADPGRSLFLMKPMVSVPHGGGKRLSTDMQEFQVIARWIAEGLHYDPADAPTLKRVEILPGPRVMALPGAKQRVVVMAHFSDGDVRDVTSLAKLTTSDEDLATISRDGLVEGKKRGDAAIIARYQYVLKSIRFTFLQDVPGFRWVQQPEQNYVDREVFSRLKLFQIPASGLSTDNEFIRRAYLDSTGLLPTADDVRKFLADTRPDKRDRLIDTLTASPEFADFWALKWADVLRIQDESLGEGGARAYHKWLRDSLAANKPMSTLVKELLTASGPLNQNPAASYFRTLRELDDGTDPSIVLSQSTAQLFMGVRIGCAKCHNHPFERWTQDEYYELAAFFAQVKVRGDEKRGITVSLDPRGQTKHLRTGAEMRPKLLGAEFPNIAQGQDRRAVLADWLTRKDNPFFARSIANRVWAHLLGRGIVEPVDDFRDSNPPANEGLIEALAKDYAEHDFDFRYLVRTIMKSRTYQLSSNPLPLNKDDGLYFSHALPRVLSAEQLSDAIGQITGVPEKFPGYPEGTRAVQMAGTLSRTPFLKTFGRPDRNLSCECEREKDPTLFQAMALMTGRAVDNRLRSDSGRLAALAASKLTNDAILEELYLSALARMPTDRERREFLSYFGQVTDRRQAVEDLAWVLINSKEFLFRH